MITKTGMGYFTDTEDHIICRYKHIPNGNMTITEGFTIHDVKTLAEFDAVVIWIDPSIPASKTEKECFLTMFDDPDVDSKIRSIIAASTP